MTGLGMMLPGLVRRTRLAPPGRRQPTPRRAGLCDRSDRARKNPPAVRHDKGALSSGAGEGT